jgi:glucose/arabinose dehydrogenase
VVKAQLIATMDQPVAMAVRPGDPALYVAEKTGRVVAVRDGDVDPKPVLDLADQISIGSEQGLLGIAFSPDGSHLYANYTDVDGNTNVEAFEMGDAVADPATQRQILFVRQPYENHNGGNLVFGPDGYLYIGLGDGGSAGDPHDNAQSLGTLLGKMLRIDPTPDGEKPYAIPPGNPFAGMEGARPEIWAYGLRNPWRYSFDRATGDLWIGDVGQNSWEEVDEQGAHSTGGENYGWNRLEGTHPYEGDPPPNAVPPVYEYPHGGCVVTGGYVYRGEVMPALDGSYVFADFCLGDLETLRPLEGGDLEHGELDLHVDSPASFGEDAAGELYVLSLEGGIYQLVPS